MKFHSLAGAIGLVLVLGACAPTQPTPVPSAPANIVNCTAGNNSTVNCAGSGNTAAPSPTPSGTPSGDNVVASFAVFCYGFGAQPGQAEPNHGACVLPPGYPQIDVTASPKNAAGIDIPRPGDQSDPAVIDWAITPDGAATLAIQSNRFNARVVPATPRVAAAFVLTATYRDPQGNVRTATKSGSIQ